MQRKVILKNLNSILGKLNPKSIQIIVEVLTVKTQNQPLLAQKNSNIMHSYKEKVFPSQKLNKNNI